MIVDRKNVDVPLVTSILAAASYASTPGAPGGPVVVCSLGPFDLLAGDVVEIAATVQFTRPMPGDATPPAVWDWYVKQPNPPNWEGAYGEDHNPAAISHRVSRVAGAADDPPNASRSTAGEYHPARPMSLNVLQDHVAKDLPGRFYNFIAYAAYTKAGAPPGTAVKVDYAQMYAAVHRG